MLNRLATSACYIGHPQDNLVRSNLVYVDAGTVFTVQNDPFLQAVSGAASLSRAAMIELVDRYFDSAFHQREAPAVAQDCEVRQNGITLLPGSCALPPGNGEFERRYPVVDEELGVVSAFATHRGQVGLYLFKLAEAQLLNIEVIGGVNSESSGW